MSRHLFPIADAENYFRKFARSFVRSDGALSWSSEEGITELSVTPIDERTFDGLLVSEIVTLTHTSPAFAGLSADRIAYLNSMATLSSLVLADDSKPTRLVAKVGIFSTDREAAERVYAPLLCTEAAVSSWHSVQIARGQFRQDPKLSPLQMTSQDPPFDNADFAAIKAITDRAGYFGSLGDRYFCVEFPWEVGALTQLTQQEEMRKTLRVSHGLSEEQLDRMAGKTSLLQILVGDHPLYGNGIRSTLELPFAPGDPATIQMANELNAWELSGADLPPHFGAWCIGARALTYVSFIPTQFCVCVPGVLHSLTVWMAGRHARVHQWLNAARSRH